MASILNHADDVEVPPSVQDFESFRRWTHSEEFPESGRIDFLLNRIEVDMSPEDLYTHGSVKAAIAYALFRIVEEEREAGDVFVDSTRIVSETAELSAEPDIVVVLNKSIDSGKVRWVRKTSGEQGRFVEWEGGPDLIVEIVSDSSTKKDTERLPKAYFDAGVREYWLVDVRKEEKRFQIHHRGEQAFQPVAIDEEGFTFSVTLGLGFRLQEHQTKYEEVVKYRLVAAEPSGQDSSSGQ